MLAKIEKWGAAHPVLLAVIIVLFSLAIGGIPASFWAYNVGFYEGGLTSDAHWRSSFDVKVKDVVEQKLSIRCGEVVGEASATCQRAAKSLERTISEKDGQIKDLQDRVDFLKRRSDIVDTHSMLTENARSILVQLSSAQEKRDVESERFARARFFSLLLGIQKTREIYADWSALFNSRATDLARQYNEKGNISTTEIATYLYGFTSDIETKRKIIDDEVSELNKIRNSKY